VSPQGKDTADVPVTRNIKGIALHSALRMLLTEMALTYVIGDDALIITASEEGRRLARQSSIDADEVRREFLKNSRIMWRLRDEAQLEFIATPLEDVMVFLEARHGISIGIDRTALSAAGIRPDVRCTINVKGVPLASALQKLLGDVDLTYVVEDEGIVITTPKNASSAENN